MRGRPPAPLVGTDLPSLHMTTFVQGAVDYDGDATEWREYVFKVKPGPTNRRPPVITPYHYRLDWLAWFLPLGSRWGGSYPSWFVSFLGKLGENDPEVTALLAKNPFEKGPAPKYMRATLYQYKFSERGGAGGRGREVERVENASKWSCAHYGWMLWWCCCWLSGSEVAKAGHWWVREEVGPFFPMRSVADIQRLMR